MVKQKKLRSFEQRYDESLLFAPSRDSLLVPSRVSKSISRRRRHFLPPRWRRRLVCTQATEPKLSSFTQRFLNQLQSPTARLLKIFFLLQPHTTSGRNFFLPRSISFFHTEKKLSRQLYSVGPLVLLIWDLANREIQ